MAKKNSYERQDQIQSELLRIAKYGFQTKTLVERLLEESAARAAANKSKPAKETKTFSNGNYSQLSDEVKAQIEATNRMAEDKAKERKKLRAAKAKAKRAQAKIDAVQAKEDAFKAMIARKAQEQIAARQLS